MLKEMAITSKAVVVSVTESHLSDDILSSEIQMAGYQLSRYDRPNQARRGGVALYIRNDLADEGVSLAGASSGCCEYQMIHFLRKNLVLVNVYKPPRADLTAFTEIMNQINQKITDLGTPLPSIIMVGDFNLPDVDWTSTTSDTNTQGRPLLKMMEELALEQLVDVPTRGDHILDLYITNREDWVSKVDATFVSGLSDHNVVNVSVNIDTMQQPEYTNENDSVLAKLNFLSDRTAWDSLREDLGAIQWAEILQDKSCSEMQIQIQRILEETCPRHVPVRRPPPKASNIPRDRKIIMRKRNKYRKKLLESADNSGQQRLRELICQLDVRLQASHEAEQLNKENAAVEKIKENPKYLFGYAKAKAQLRSRVGPFFLNNGLVTEPLAKSEVLREQYKTVFSSPKYSQEENLQFVQEQMTRGTLTDIDFTDEELAECLNELNPKSSSGPDGVHASILRQCREILKEPLATLWRSSLDEGTVPEPMKMGSVTPIYKGKEKHLPANYRPVVLTSHVIKAQEKLIVRRLRDYLERENILNSNQHGFRQGRSCLSQLLDHHAMIVSALAEGEAVDVIYLDFAKAFDKVDHGVLLRKLARIGIGGNLLKWIHSFLTQRQQAVRVEGSMSSNFEVISGVPQGSVLGPLLFLIHIYDIDDEVEYSRTASFADDTRVSKNVKEITDCDKLQADLGKIYEWADFNHMEFNQSKFELIRYGKHPDFDYQYKTADGNQIEEKDGTKDLGVFIDKEITFKNHINEAVLSAKKVMGITWRTFRTRERLPMLTIYKACIRPLLEYGCQLWCPRQIGDIQKLEAIQRTFTSRIAGLRALNYWERLENLGLYSLERRRERYIIIYVWKIISGLIINFSDPRSRIVTRDNPRFGRICRVPTVSNRLWRIWSIHQYSLSVTGPKLFNKLPRDLREYNGSLESFKNRLDVFLRSVEDQPVTPHYYQVGRSNSLLDRIGGAVL